MAEHDDLDASGAPNEQDSSDEDRRIIAELSRRWDPERLSKFLSDKAGSGKRLDLSTRNKFERILGTNLGHVRVFTGALAEEVTRAHGAEALTLGNTGVILMRGTSGFGMSSRAGQALLGHELTHVAQANAGYARRAADGGTGELTHEEAEAQAEQIEAALHHDEHGGAAPENPAEKEGHSKDKKEKLVEKVLELWREEMRILGLRHGLIR